MTKNTTESLLTIHLVDSSRNVDRILHRLFKKWVPATEQVFSDFMVSAKGLKLKSRKLQQVDLSLTFCGERKIKTLNREYRGKDKVTDVLSFPLYESLRPESCDSIFSPHIELGDVVICLPVARRQAVEFEVTLVEEIIHQLVHGFLHLVGFDHERGGKEELLMNTYEESLVAKIYELRK